MARSVRNKTTETTEDWCRYELAMFNELYYVYRSPEFIVLPDYREIEGQITGGKRQIDVAVLHRSNLSRPFISVESKFYTRKVDVKHVEAFIGMEQELGSQHAIMVSPHGFTDMAHRRVRGTNIQLLTLPQEEADRLNWRAIARGYFRIDESYHPEMGDAIHVFSTTNDYDDLVEIMEQLPFDEWDRLFHIYRRVNRQRCRATLVALSYSYDDRDWIFNTVRLLDEFGWLDEDIVEKLLKASRVDYDLWNYLKDMGYVDDC
jgi:hypothetical protein